ncbi:winged helix-turn-helix domain-containing protein [Streptomyces sp. NPDC085466]|uniref:winged helix-turn-helix domain-containing protein n=1 Tax=Streptomyces sp. NPDC085466 TaxID=3365725 RepID=UPI0037D552B8
MTAWRSSSWTRRTSRPAAVSSQTVDELVARVDVDVGRSTVAHHLKILVEARFVLAEKRGTLPRHRPAPSVSAATTAGGGTQCYWSAAAWSSASPGTRRSRGRRRGRGGRRR